MILEQHYLACLSQASYLVADERSRTAAIVDPRRDIDVYLERAKSLGLVIRHVAETHIHADFVPGHLELAARTGATIHLCRHARAQFPHQPFLEGQPIVLGSAGTGVQLEAIETPGHTPESLCVLVREGTDPKALLSGDTLFIGDVGRPDLLVSRGSSAAELAGRLYDSLHGKLAALPDELTLYPGHGAGSACGKSLSNETVSTLGAQRRTNPMLQPMARERFVELATSGLGTPPRYFGYDATLNRELRPVLEELYAPASRTLPLSAVLELMREGAVVLDTREPDEFAPRHLCGSVNIGLSGKFATWVGTLLDPMRPIVLITPPGKERESITRLARIGFDRVAGCLEGGIRALDSAPEHIRAFERIDAPALAERMLAEPLAVLDVRAEGERSAARIADSHFLPLPELLESTPDLLKDRPLAVHCAGGYRSTIACSLLEARGFTRLIDLRGGMSGWIAGGQPVQRG